MKLKALFSGLLLSAACAAEARADIIPYPTIGVVNPVTYSFTAASTGHVIAYFAGSTASYDNELGMLINGVLSPSGFGLDNHTSALGATFDLGAVKAGDALTFVLHNLTLGADAYSDPSLNGAYDSIDGPHAPVNHIYSTPYTGTGPIIDSIPPGTYVAFEDFPASNPPDYNYHDETFVFTGVAAAAAPEPATLSLACLGIAGLCGYSWKKRKFRCA
jgi:hypothetical protein